MAKRRLRACIAGRQPLLVSDLLNVPFGDRIQIPYAEYEQNASNSTMRVTCRSDTHPLVLLAGDIVCLCGFAHCEANEAAPNVATP